MKKETEKTGKRASILLSFPELRTSRLLLRRMVVTDMDAFSEIVRYGMSSGGKSAEDIFRVSEEQRMAGQAITWVLDLRGEMIGTCGFYRGFTNDSGEIGFAMRAAFRNCGYTKEASRAIIEFGFFQLGLKQITAYTRDSNRASIATLNALGFEITGERKEDYVEFVKMG